MAFLPAQKRISPDVSTILLADDDQLLRLIMRERLERAGHEVLECGDGFAALELATQERPDCLVLDVMMPLARGLEVVRQVRRHEDWHPGIVMVSARTRVTDRLNALEAGADIYLEKPVAPDALVEAVTKLTRDTTPTRLVDVLGPVWATLAMDRLLQRAAARRPADAAALQTLFSEQILAALGRGIPHLAPAPPAIGVMWERLLRGLLGDVTDPTVPIATDIRAPDALEAVRAITVPAGDPEWNPRSDLTATWARVLSQVLPTRGAADLEHTFAGALQHVLGIRAATSDRWAQVLSQVLGHRTTTAGTPGQVLEATIGDALGTALGLHSHETRIWAHTLATVLAHQRPHVTTHVGAMVGAALRESLGTGPKPSSPANERMWAAAIDDILRSEATAPTTDADAWLPQGATR